MSYWIFEVLKTANFLSTQETVVFKR